MKRNDRHAAKRNTWAYRALGAATAVVVTGALGAGCLTRPVQRAAPLTKLNFTNTVASKAIDKVDLLFMIDNSSSMGDKQTLLVDVVPDLLGRLVAPNCVDAVTGKASGQSVQADGTCADASTKPEFPAVHNMHVGIVSSSIGDQGANVACPTSNSRNNDHAYLLQQDANKGNIAQVADNNGFIAWFPAVKANQDVTNGPAHPTATVGSTTDKTGPGLFGGFSQLIGGVGENGCGYEAQLESWYRFLIQPDPYASIDATNTARALVGFDKTILQQRHDFLRPDSLVAVIALTDENDSTVDPMALSGTAWFFEDTVNGAPRATSQCATNPKDPKCQNCALAKITTGDPSCAKGVRFGKQDPADGTNIRFYHMKQRFGVDPQFPIQRYIDGLSSTIVPNRDGEHPPLKGGAGVSSSYVGNKNCTNPLFATELPSGDAADDPKAGDVDGPLCGLTQSTRSPTQVFFATIGGIPWQLLTTDPSDGNAPFKDSIGPDDWEHIIGKDPLNYDFTNADIHMVESATARNGIGNPDPYNTRDWDTTSDSAGGGPNDLEYACTFDLKALNLQRDCAAAKGSCDCATGSKAPLCDKTNATTQVLGKTYPTIREFSVVRGLGEQGIAASLCPRSFDTSSQYFGYRPAVASIINKLKAALNNTCVPQKLIPDPNNNNNVPCLVLVTLYGNKGGEELCTPDTYAGLSVPDPEVLAKFRQNQEAVFKQQGGNAQNPADYPVCELAQIPVPVGTTCVSDQTAAGWCYVENTPDQGANGPAGTCGQSIFFTASGAIPGGQSSVQCIEQDNLGSSAGTPPTEAGAASTGDTE